MEEAADVEIDHEPAVRRAASATGGPVVAGRVAHVMDVSGQVVLVGAIVGPSMVGFVTHSSSAARRIVPVGRPLTVTCR